jgi:hypothetical protein
MAHRMDRNQAPRGEETSDPAYDSRGGLAYTETGPRRDWTDSIGYIETRAMA